MKRFDVSLLISIILLTIFGLLMIYNASSVIALEELGDKYHFFKSQLMWLFLGYIVLVITSLVSYKLYYNLSVPLLVAAIIMLILIFVPGIGDERLGASRWLNLGFFSFQPSEFVKLSLAIYLSAWFSHKEKSRFIAFCLLIGFVLLLIMLQPNMSTAIIILFEALVVYFLSGGSLKQFAVVIPTVFIIGVLLVLQAPYRAARLTTYLRINESLNNPAFYHVKQILIALGSGGLTGVGLGNSLQKYAYLPENTTDSIFAIIAEELGFLGAALLVMVFLFIIWRGFMISVHAKDTFGKLLAAAIISFLGIQAVINLSAMTQLIPLTGVPLPFVSYGGSALVVDLWAIGILLNISRQAAVHKRA